MSEAAIAFEQESLRYFESLLQGGSAAIGAHCGDEDDETYCGAIALGAHCGDEDDE